MFRLSARITNSFQAIIFPLGLIACVSNNPRLPNMPHSAPRSSEPLVTVEIMMSEVAQPFSNATAYVRLEEVTYADAPAHLIAEDVINNVSYTGSSNTIATSVLHGQIADSQAHYSIRVHLDLDGDRQISRGDYISTESYPVLTHGHPNHVSVRVQAIG
jgi:uncharacterized lipoprotein YbaY